MVEIEITPPGGDGRPWWRLRWDGTETHVDHAPGLEGEHPEDWGIHCTHRDHTDAWLAEGGSAYVVEQIIDGFASAGAKARIVALHGTTENRGQILETLRTYAEKHPKCSGELRRFANEETEVTPP